MNGKQKRKRIIQFYKGNLVLLRASRVLDRKNEICAKLMSPLEGQKITDNEKGVNSYVLKYTNSEKSIFLLLLRMFVLLTS